MLRQRKLRDRLVAMAAPPIVVSMVVAVALVVGVDAGDGRSIGLLAVAVTAAVAIWCLLVGWTIVRSLNSLAIASSGLAEAQARIASGELEATELPGIELVGPADEIGRVAESVNAISRSAVELAQSQRELIRKGLATIVINLARRNQSLLDRQVEYLDRLEQSEEDPERLAELFRVDHLATRMRRNAESLLVLAGADTTRRKGAPVAMSDVLRVAIGEVENYQHIELGVVEEGEVPAGVAVDLAHLTAELMENATQFSPPSTTVEVSAIVERTDGCLTISVADRGMGLGDRLDLANETLADPPELGLGMGRSLGFMVIGRLARRLGAAVRLHANEGGGTIAEVRVPLSLFHLEDDDQPTPASPATPPPTHRQTQAPAVAPNPSPNPTATAPPAPTAAPTAAQPPIPQPQAAPETVASTTLEKLLGIAPTPVTPATPVAAPVPPPAPEPVGGDLDWQHTSPFDGATPEMDTMANPSGQPPLPPPAEDPTWGSLATGTTSVAGEPAWSPPAAGTPAPADDQLPSTDQPANRADEAPAWSAPAIESTPATDNEPTWAPPPAEPVPPPAAEPMWSPPPLESQQPQQPTVIEPTWAPPAVTPPPPVAPSAPSRLDEALPSGDAFENGVASLLGQPDQTATGWPDTSVDDDEPKGLQKRQRGASNVPIGQGRPVAATSRSPEEVRAMLSRYREGLKGGGKKDNGSAPTRDRADDKDGER